MLVVRKKIQILEKYVREQEKCPPHAQPSRKNNHLDRFMQSRVPFPSRSLPTFFLGNTSKID